MVGQTISHYKILERLGAGGVGVVYKAHDQQLDRVVAIKFLASASAAGPQERARFIMEAKAASALESGHIGTIHEIDQTETGELFIVMTCYEGRTLKQHIAEGPLPASEAANIGLQIARGLAKAHERDIIHRDIKPANAIVTIDGIVKILDFGLAKLAAEIVAVGLLTPAPELEGVHARLPATIPSAAREWLRPSCWNWHRVPPLTKLLARPRRWCDCKWE
jgi:serine/threonine protein kinase